MQTILLLGHVQLSTMTHVIIVVTRGIIINANLYPIQYSHEGSRQYTTVI
uniref:Uncharacterized protein n=1 Tax=Meloidogyne enterolobii TaxID=390850 RepID=A0A6V7URC9_MELEN|nr:unnamed protein product [Meloidogyne enterolobii]CAD2163871.1 unnamed protein product [Meloidogyne enterolobii]